jgi:hypothetical protein
MGARVTAEVGGVLRCAYGRGGKMCLRLRWARHGSRGDCACGSSVGRHCERVEHVAVASAVRVGTGL